MWTVSFHNIPNNFKQHSITTELPALYFVNSNNRISLYKNQYDKNKIIDYINYRLQYNILEIKTWNELEEISHKPTTQNDTILLIIANDTIFDLYSNQHFIEYVSNVGGIKKIYRYNNIEENKAKFKVDTDKLKGILFYNIRNLDEYYEFKINTVTSIGVSNVIPPDVLFYINSYSRKNKYNQIQQRDIDNSDHFGFPTLLFVYDVKHNITHLENYYQLFNQLTFEYSHEIWCYRIFNCCVEK